MRPSDDELRAPEAVDRPLSPRPLVPDDSRPPAPLRLRPTARVASPRTDSPSTRSQTTRSFPGSGRRSRPSAPAAPRASTRSSASRAAPRRPRLPHLRGPATSRPLSSTGRGLSDRPCDREPPERAGPSPRRPPATAPLPFDVPRPSEPALPDPLSPSPPRRTESLAPAPLPFRPEPPAPDLAPVLRPSPSWRRPPPDRPCRLELLDERRLERSEPGMAASLQSAIQDRKSRRGPAQAGPPLEKSGGDLLSQGESTQVPSAQFGLTSVFGMGTGVTQTQ